MSVYLSKIYTKAGVTGGRPRSSEGASSTKTRGASKRTGTVDELNSVVGLCRTANRTEAGPEAARATIDGLLARVQNELFNLGSLLATLPEDLHPQQPRIATRHVEALERDIDMLNEHLPPLRSFTLPGGGWVSSYLHLARTVCRRTERCVVRLSHTDEVDPEAVRYLNRLSDMLYVLGRWNVRERAETEPLWTPEST